MGKAINMQDNYYSSKEFKTLLKQYEAAWQQGGSVYFDPDQLTDIAEYYYGAGQHQLSLHTIEHALSIFPDATAPLIFMARHELVFRKNTKLARQYLEKITDTTDLEYIYLYAEILINENKTDEAEAYLQEAYKKLNDEDDLADFVLDVANMYADYDQPALARQWLNKSDEPHLADYKEIEGRIAISQGQYKKSEDIFNKLLDENPYSTPYWNHLASSQLRRNHISEAITSSEYSIAINPNDAEAILNKANGLYALTNFDEALHYYKRFTQLCPDEHTGYLLQGITLLSLNQPEQALSQLLQAEKRLAEGAEALLDVYNEIAFTLSLLNRIDEALAYIDKAEKLEKADKSLLHVMRGNILLQHEQTNEALRQFQIATNMPTSTDNTLYHIAISLYDCGHIELARDMFDTLVYNVNQDQGTDGYAYLAACYDELGHHEQYLRHLKKACAVNPNETRTVFFGEFPPDLPPEEYYNYALHQ